MIGFEYQRVLDALVEVRRTIEHFEQSSRLALADHRAADKSHCTRAQRAELDAWEQRQLGAIQGHVEAGMILSEKIQDVQRQARSAGVYVSALRAR